MNYFIFIFFIILSSAACPKYYYTPSGQESCVYCNGVVSTGENNQSLCTPCADGSFAYHGVCVSATETCPNGIPYGQTYETETGCGTGYFGITTASCIQVNNEWVDSTEYTNGCFGNSPLNNGYPLGKSAVNMQLEISGVDPSAFNTEAKLNIVYSVLNAFPFAIADIQIGGIISVNAIGEEPKVRIYLRIVTMQTYYYIFQNLVTIGNVYTTPSQDITHYLRTNGKLYFHQEIQASIVYCDYIQEQITCDTPTDLPEEYISKDLFILDDILYYSCSNYNDVENIGFATRKCSISDNTALFTSLEYSNCYPKYPAIDSDVEYIDFKVILNKIPLVYINCNITSELYPLFVEIAGTKLNDMFIYGFRPHQTEQYSTSTEMSIRYVVKKDEMHLYETTKTIKEVLVNQLTLEEFKPLIQTIREKFNYLDPSRFHEFMVVEISDFTVNGIPLETEN
ncbi:hypothetical protein WA158_000203 [Blastocystis sp. Blastoise]